MLPVGQDPRDPGTNPTPQISLQDINVELKNSPTAQISMNDTRVRLLANQPSGQMAMSYFYNKYCRTIYRATACNGVTGANSLAYNGGDGEVFNSEIYPNQTDYATTTNPTIDIYSFTGKPTATVAGTICVAAKAVTSHLLYGYVDYSIDNGATWTSWTLSDTNINNYYASVTCNPNNIQIRVQGRHGTGGSIKLGTDWEEFSSVLIYDIFFRV